MRVNNEGSSRCHPQRCSRHTCSGSSIRPPPAQQPQCMPAAHPAGWAPDRRGWSAAGCACGAPAQPPQTPVARDGVPWSPRRPAATLTHSIAGSAQHQKHAANPALACSASLSGHAERQRGSGAPTPTQAAVPALVGSSSKSRIRSSMGLQVKEMHVKGQTTRGTMHVQHSTGSTAWSRSSYHEPGR